MPKTTQTSYILAATGIKLSEASQENPQRTFSGIANSGRVFTRYGEQTVIDLTDLVHKAVVPILFEHERSRPVASGNLSVTDKGLVISGKLLSNSDGQEVAQAADEGFPWEMSIDVRPQRIEQLSAGESALVNGHQVAGPCQIFRKCTIREVSFTATGVDDQTSVVVLSESSDSKTMETTSMTIEELQAKIKVLEAAKETSDKEVTDLKKKLQEAQDKLATKEKESKTAQVDAKLSEVGFKRDKDSKWVGLSEATYGVLLSADIDTAFAMIADFKPQQAEVPEHLLSEQTVADGTQLSDNPLLDDAKQRTEKGSNYV